MKVKSKSSKRGGALYRLARLGRFGDTELAHVNKEEAALLKARGGSGSINPRTGLREYFYGGKGGQPDGGKAGPETSNPGDGDQKEDRPSPNKTGGAGPADSVAADAEAKAEEKAKTKAAADRHRAALEEEYAEIGEEVTTPSTESPTTGLAALFDKNNWHATPDAPPGYHGSRVGWADQYRQQSGFYNGPTSELGFHEVRKRSQMSPAAARAYSRKVASINHPALSKVSRVGSFLLPGIDTYLSYDEYGQLGYDKGFSPTEMALGFTGNSTSGVVKALNGAVSVAEKAGLFSHKTYRNFQTVAEANLERAKNQRQRAAFGKDEVSSKSKNIYETAIQTLYPQEEQYRPLLGMGVKTGASAVHRAPNLSTLNAKRANFGRVR